jgi:hypothetical protein
MRPFLAARSLEGRRPTPKEIIAESSRNHLHFRPLLLAQLPQFDDEIFFGGDGLAVADSWRGIIVGKPDVVKTKLIWTSW